MVKSDETLRIRQTTLLNTVRTLDQTISKNMTRTETKIGQMNASLANDILQTRSDIVDVLANKISTRNFTKLINDSQNVVDQLYGMVSPIFIDLSIPLPVHIIACIWSQFLSLR